MNKSNEEIEKCPNCKGEIDFLSAYGDDNGILFCSIECFEEYENNKGDYIFEEIKDRKMFKNEK